MSNTSMGSDNFAEIVLDTTLAELLAEEPGWEAGEVLCNVKPCADPTHSTVPLNKKFLITSAQATDSDDLAHLQLENVNKLLSFWAGHMEVAFVGCEGLSNDDELTRDAVDQKARTDFSVLSESQRPWPRVFANSEQFVQHYRGGNTQVRWGFAVDFAENLPCVVHPEVQYMLNSKRWLAECPLKSANDQIIDPQCSCSTHTTNQDQGQWYFDSNCGTCKNAIKQEVTRLKTLLQNTEPPFVLKLAQSLGSVGTMIVKNNEERAKTVEAITRIQEESLRFVTANNAHIHPASLVLSDFLPGDMKALNFYIRRNGTVKFLGAGQQLGTRLDGRIQHTTVTWSEQDELEQRYKDKLAEIGEVLKDAGYFGPCGADIIQTDDAQYVIDLNVRTSTSMILGLLKQHCNKRGFNVCGVYECILLSLSRDALEKNFHDELNQGRLILLGTTQLGKKDKWAYPVVVAGEDNNTIEELSARVLSFEAKGGDDAGDAGGA